jgi:hypothetical protein
MRGRRARVGDRGLRPIEATLEDEPDLVPAHRPAHVIDAHQPFELDRAPELLFTFADRCLGRRLADFQHAAGRCPQVPAVSLVHEQDFASGGTSEDHDPARERGHLLERVLRERHQSG